MTPKEARLTAKTFTKQQLDLLKEAAKAAERAYAPYSGFRVGAAVLGTDGRIFSGCNVENASYGLSLCAERAALARAVEEGCHEIVGVAVSCIDAAPGPSGILPEEAAAPCGACRQWLTELAPKAWLVTNSFHKPIMTKDLLPFSFSL